MRTFVWILTKVSPLFSALGALSLLLFWVASDGAPTILTCAIIGACLSLCGIPWGLYTWKYNIAPAPLLFMSANEIMDSKFGCVVMWMGRLFMLPFACAGACYFYYL